jgi:DNA-binding HxlR family transcriptional regulator
MVSMNRLTTEKRAQIVGALVEGNSIRATVRMTGAAKNTVTKLLVDLGAACEDYQERVMRDLPCRTVEVDEIWAYCYAKSKNVPEEHRGTFGYGDVWTWTALCADTKLVPTWLVGERTVQDGWAFLNDLKVRLRDPHIQLTSDGHPAYSAAVGLSFGRDLDYAQLIKIFGQDPRDERRYSPPVCTGTEIRVLKGNPDRLPAILQFVKRAVTQEGCPPGDDVCPVCATAEVVCAKWTILVIRDLAAGRSRFCELERSLAGISPRTLSLRLRALEEEGIVERRTYPEVPPRVEYELTEKGLALLPLIEDMRRYGREWLGASAGTPVAAAAA